MNDCIVPHVSSPNQLPLFDPIEIPLTQGQVALVDPVDSDLAELKWCAARTGTLSGFYAVRGKRTVFMHRVVLQRILGRPLTSKDITDHINGNGLDNRRSNLRLATAQQNNWNKRRSNRNTSGFKGVNFHKASKLWRAVIGVNHHNIEIGYFHTPEEAHAAYVAAAQKYAGEFARSE